MSTVTHVYKQPSGDGSHLHISRVRTAEGISYSRAEVVRGLDAGESWRTWGGGAFARIRKVAGCPHPDCPVAPYITTDPDHTAQNNLDGLPPF